MPDTLLAGHLHDERTRAARALLRTPLLDIDADPDAFRLVARHHAWLAERFETTCGWHLTIDAAAGFARLAKRAADGGMRVVSKAFAEGARDAHQQARQIRSVLFGNGNGGGSGGTAGARVAPARTSAKRRGSSARSRRKTQKR